MYFCPKRQMRCTAQNPAKDGVLLLQVDENSVENCLGGRIARGRQLRQEACENGIGARGKE